MAEKTWICLHTLLRIWKCQWCQWWTPFGSVPKGLGWKRVHRGSVILQIFNKLGMRGSEQDDLKERIILVARGPVYSFSSFPYTFPQIYVLSPCVFHLLTLLPPQKFRMKIHLFRCYIPFVFLIFMPAFWITVLNIETGSYSLCSQAWLMSFWKVRPASDLGVDIVSRLTFMTQFQLFHCVPSSVETWKKWCLRKTAHHRIRNHSLRFQVLI